MMLILYTCLSIFMLTTLMMFLSTILSKKSITDREKSSPFECGFDPKSSSRMPFSLNFFLIAMIFLIFDVEVALIMPLIITLQTSSTLTYLLITFFFFLILLLGLIHEWKQGALNWIY